MPKASKRQKLLRRTPSHERSRATVDTILEGTARTLVARGYAGTTTNHIASEAGVGIGSFYEYFSDKDDAVAAVVNRFAARAFAHAVQSARTALAMRQLPAVNHFIEEMVRFIAAEADLVRTLYQQVPFVWEMPRVQGLVAQLERFGLELAHPNGMTPNLKMQDRFYVLGVAVGASLIQIATDPTVVSRQKQLTDELSLMITRYLSLGGGPA